MEIGDCLGSIFVFLNTTSYFFYYFFVFGLGCLAAYAELLSRYSNGFKILYFRESRIYLALNGIAALIAYWFLKRYEIDLGPFTKYDIGKVLTAGFSSMVILRSSFASIKVDNKKIDAGLAPLLQIFLNTADRALNQSRSKTDLEEITALMKGVDFLKASKELPNLCINLMENLSREDGEQIGKEIKSLTDDISSNETKAINLGIILNRLTRIELLKAVVSSVKNAISIDADSKEQEKINDIDYQQIKIKELKNMFKS